MDLSWVAVPAAVSSALAAVVSAAWVYYSTRDLKRIESRLRREEEAFRVAHSPRVSSGLDLWCAFCEFERAVFVRVYPSQASFEAPGALGTGPDREELIREATEALKISWRKLTAARDRAEALLPASAFAAFDSAFESYTEAHDAAWETTAMDVPQHLANPRVHQHMAVAKERRKRALDELRTMMGADSRC